MISPSFWIKTSAAQSCHCITHSIWCPFPMTFLGGDSCHLFELEQKKKVLLRLKKSKLHWLYISRSVSPLYPLSTHLSPLPSPLSPLPSPLSPLPSPPFPLLTSGGRWAPTLSLVLPEVSFFFFSLLWTFSGRWWKENSGSYRFLMQKIWM